MKFSLKSSWNSFQTLIIFMLPLKLEFSLPHLRQSNFPKLSSVFIFNIKSSFSYLWASITQHSKITTIRNLILCCIFLSAPINGINHNPSYVWLPWVMAGLFLSLCTQYTYALTISTKSGSYEDHVTWYFTYITYSKYSRRNYLRIINPWSNFHKIHNHAYKWSLYLM